jgi:putative transcriptional regulator
MVCALLLVALWGAFPAGGAFSATNQMTSPAQGLQTRAAPSFPPSTQLNKGKFLVASRELGDPRFSETVVLLVEYGAAGAAGLIVNRPTEVALSTVWPDVEGLKRHKAPLHIGGPVEITVLQMLIQSHQRRQDSQHVFADIYVSVSAELLTKMAGETDSGERFRVYAGYAGWAEGQLEAEVLRGDWHIFRADTATLFDKDPAAIWPDLIRRTEGRWTLLQPAIPPSH